MRSTPVACAVAILLGLAIVQSSFARVQYFQQFEKQYLTDHPDKKYAEAVKKAADKCYVCHQGKKSKKNHNEFGDHVKELLTKNDMKNVEKIKASLEKCLALPVDPKKPKGETYLDRVKAGKWPGGELDDLKKEPADAEKADAGN